MLPSEAASELPARANILGVRVSVCDYASVVEAVLAAARAQRSLLVTAADVNQIMQARADRLFAAALNTFEVITPDGQPVRWGLRWTRQARLADRVYGPTLMLRLCERAAAEGVPVALYGSRPDTLERLRRALEQHAPGLQVVAQIAGRFRPLDRLEMDADAAVLGASGARIVFVGMGCPRQEWWAFLMRPALPCAVVAVGAAFDFHAGMVAQAPPWMQKRGLEWLFRLSREPRRLWRRYVLVTPRYLPLIALQACGFRFPAPSELRGAYERPCPG
jgi:N-acetylglucosaminyldiphosphoundecaprenol N-acetyl-beta-D-mannosaminyltransferase